MGRQRVASLHGGSLLPDATRKQMGRVRFGHNAILTCVTSDTRLVSPACYR
jgi:hypothetical protein